MPRIFMNALALLGFVSVLAINTGCANPAKNAIYAQVPGSNRPIATKTPGEGQYTLYHVLQSNEFGQPTEAKVIVTYHLPRGEPIGFRWVYDRARRWEPNEAVRLEAFAGDHVNQLGPITTINERYYWANPSDWGHYWSVEPAFGFQRTVLLQQ